MSSSDWLILAVVVTLFLFSTVLALSEMAFARMSRIRALTLEEEGRKGAARLARMLEKPEQTINTLLLLLLVSQLTSASLIGILLERHFGAYGVLIGLVLQIVLFFVVGEVIPKTYAIQNTDRAALAMSGFLYAITNIRPLHAISRALIGFANALLPGRGLKEGPFVTEEDLRTMADVAADEESIEREERRLIHSIFEFGDTVVREVMKPRPDMVVIEADDPIEEAIERAIEGGFSRLPAYEETTDNIVGLVYLKDLVRRARSGGATEPVRSLLRPAVFVPEQKRLAELLHEMQERQFHMAIVVDEHGGTAGLVTMEDLLEEIVGEITDEYDVEEPGIEHLSAGALRVAGSLSIHDLSDELGVVLPDEEWDTVGGLVFNLLGHVPVDGETVRFQGFDFVTEQVQGRRIVSVQVCPACSASPDFRSGFATVVGRPNVGKSTLVNRLVGTKVAITSPRPQTTRTTIRGVRTTAAHQLVLLDTPGFHRPRTALGERTNERARATLAEVDVICLVVAANEAIGRGDRFISELVHGVATPSVLIVNKVDAVGSAAVVEHLARAAEWLGDFAAYFPVSARTGEGIPELAAELESRLPLGPHYYPDDVVTDQPEMFVAAELLREQLLRLTKEEVPHSITVEVEPIDDDGDDGRHPDDVLRLRAVVRVERDSQKGIVIGRGGALLKEAGTAARRELEALLGTRVYLETTVRVEPNWQRRPQTLDRLGY